MDHKFVLLFVAVIAGFEGTAHATNVGPNILGLPKPATLIPTTAPESCPAPTDELLACMRKWACQSLIRLDLRCLLNLNGLPLVGGLLGGSGSTSTSGSGTGATGIGGLLGGSNGGLLGGTTGLLGSLLG